MNAEQAPKAASCREASDTSTDRLRRGSGNGTRRNTGNPAGGVARANRQPERVRPGRSGWRRGPLYRGSRVTPVEGRGLGWRAARDGGRDVGTGASLTTSLRRRRRKLPKAAEFDPRGFEGGAQRPVASPQCRTLGKLVSQLCSIPLIVVRRLSLTARILVAALRGPYRVLRPARCRSRSIPRAPMSVRVLRPCSLPDLSGRRSG